MGVYGPRTTYVLALKDFPGTHEFLLLDEGYSWQLNWIKIFFLIERIAGSSQSKPWLLCFTDGDWIGKWQHVKETTEIGEGKLFSPGNLRATFDNPDYDKVSFYFTTSKRVEKSISIPFIDFITVIPSLTNFLCVSIQQLINYYVKEKYTLRYTGGMVPDVNQVFKFSDQFSLKFFYWNDWTVGIPFCVSTLKRFCFKSTDYCEREGDFHKCDISLNQS